MTVFLSYRRADTQDLAGRLADRLAAQPGIGRVFLDTEGIAPGADFRARIAASLDRGPTCVVLIGQAWHGPRPDGVSRIFDTNDMVRMEVAHMLSHGLRVIPVLGNGTKMPAEADLPTDIAALARLNAMEVHHASFARDVTALAEAILGKTVRRRASIWNALMGASIAAAMVVVVAQVHNTISDHSLAVSLGGPVPVILFVITAIIIGIWAGLYRAKR